MEKYNEIIEEDFVYEKPSLIEIVCELRWQLQGLPGVPGAQYDPHYQALKEDVQKAAPEIGFKEIEVVAPEEFPIEFRPGAPDIRFRVAKDRWPLFQIGPGLLSVNVVPPYGGWWNFKGTVENCFREVIRSYPVAERYMKFTRLELRYINAFGSQFDYNSIYEFSTRFLEVRPAISGEVERDFVERTDEIDVAQRIVFPLKGMPDRMTQISLASGKKGDEPAAIYDLTIRSEPKKAEFLSVEKLIEWFDGSHNKMRDLFQKTTKPELRQKMGEKRPVERK